MTHEPWIQTFTGKRFTPFNPNPDDIDIEDIAHALSNLCRFTGHTKKFYCVTPDTKILTSELVWKNAGDLILFEGLVGFDENTGENGCKSNNRKMRRRIKYSNVLHNGIIKRHVYKLHLSDGSMIKSSEEHPWLICLKKSRNQKWETTKNIVNKINAGKQVFMLKFLDTWNDSDLSDYDKGYLSGIFDGEGCLCCKRKGFEITLSQNHGVVLDKTIEILNKNNFNFKRYNKNVKLSILQQSGKWFDRFKFLGTVRPERLLLKFKQEFKFENLLREFDSIDILSITHIEDLGMQDVVALETSTKTYFAEGFGAHNSVAQHSVFVSSLTSDKHKLSAIMHDASEAYISDISTPLKMSSVFDAYREIEDNLSRTIYKKFGLPEFEPPEIKKADKIALATEAYSFLNLREDWVLQEKPLDIKLISLTPNEAKALFLKTFKELTNGK